jgi:hypothetical protein
MKFFRRTIECTLFDYNRKEKFFEDLKAEPFKEKLRRYKSNWLRHVNRMNSSSRVAKIVLNCRPNGRTRFGRPLKTQLDKAETGLSRPNW